MVVGVLLGAYGLYSWFGEQSANQRKEDKVVLDRRWIGWLLILAWLFYILVFHYLANLPLLKEPLYVLTASSHV